MTTPQTPVRTPESWADAAGYALAAHRDLDRLRREVESATERRRDAVRALRAAGWTHEAIADLLGVARPRAVQIAQGQSSGRSPKREA